MKKILFMIAVCLVSSSGFANSCQEPAMVAAKDGLVKYDIGRQKPPGPGEEVIKLEHSDIWVDEENMTYQETSENSKRVLTVSLTAFLVPRGTYPITVVFTGEDCIADEAKVTVTELLKK